MMPKAHSLVESLLLELQELAERISVAEYGDDPRAIKRARLTLDEAVKRFSEIAANIDPVRRPASIFDPSDPNTAGRVVALTLVAQDFHPLSVIPEFYGSGVYALYYKGDFKPYAPLRNLDHPVYVGKADPNAPSAKDAMTQGTALWKRLAEHAKSIRASKTLNIEDFRCRFLIVQSGFQASAEGYLINFFKPIWNSEQKICFGIGKHGDSAGTRGNGRSPWDTMHPGRKWADATTKDQKPRELILKEIESHFLKYPPYKDIHGIFEKFIKDIQQISIE